MLLTYQELHNWSLFFSQDQFNSTEIQLALISQQIASLGGAKNTKIDDFLIASYKAKKTKDKPNRYMNAQQILMALSR